MQDYQQLLTLGTSMYAVAQDEQMGLAGLLPRVSVRLIRVMQHFPHWSQPQINSSSPRTSIKQGACGWQNPWLFASRLCAVRCVGQAVWCHEQTFAAMAQFASGCSRLTMTCTLMMFSFAQPNPLQLLRLSTASGAVSHQLSTGLPGGQQCTPAAISTATSMYAVCAPTYPDAAFNTTGRPQVMRPAVL